MAEIGYYGGVKFKVWRDGGKIRGRSFKDLSASYSVNYAEHKRYKSQPYLEYSSMNSREFNITIICSAEWGYEVSKIRKKLWEYMKKGKPNTLVIGRRKICDNKLVITNMEVGYTVFIPGSGKCQRQEITLTLREWIKKKKTKKKKTKKKKAKKKSYTTYVTKKGDTLWKIAKKFYGNGKKWKKIYNANKDVLKNTKPPKPGITLKIPKINNKKSDPKDHFIA